MACEHQLQAWRPALGGPVKFSQPTNGRAYTPIELPCGQCILCRLEHARQWAVRITHEAQLHETSSFITLTYDDKHLPEDHSLNYKKDMQPFWKRLRKAVGKLSYYAVGEYGDNTQRPHYHACVFGHAFTEGRLVIRETPTRLWTNQLLAETWGKGHVSVGALTFQTAQYTAAYCTKKLNNARRYVRIDPVTGELIEIEQPRAYMSLNPAIGLRWIEQYSKNTYDLDHVVVNGTPQKPPRFYDTWLGKKEEQKLEKIKTKRRLNVKRKTKAQTHARARNAHARAESKRKTL